MCPVVKPFDGERDLHVDGQILVFQSYLTLFGNIERELHDRSRLILRGAQHVVPSCMKILFLVRSVLFYSFMKL